MSKRRRSLVRLVTRRPRECPNCGHRPLGPIEYGYPVFSEDEEQRWQWENVMIGGCIVSDDDPDRWYPACRVVIWPDGRHAPAPRDPWRR